MLNVSYKHYISAIAIIIGVSSCATTITSGYYSYKNNDKNSLCKERDFHLDYNDCYNNRLIEASGTFMCLQAAEAFCYEYHFRSNFNSGNPTENFVCSGKDGIYYKMICDYTEYRRIGPYSVNTDTDMHFILSGVQIITRYQYGNSFPIKSD